MINKDVTEYSGETSAETQPLLFLNDVKVKIGGILVLDNITMTINPGQHWAVTGKSGSGKTTLLKTLAGLQSVTSGILTAPLLESIILNNPGDEIRMYWHHFSSWVDIKPKFRATDGVTQVYYQQRFNAGDAASIINVRDYLLNVNKLYGTNEEEFTQVIQLLSLNTQLEKTVIQLSSGETRRLMVAAALLKKPRLLLMDMPMTGLDAEGKSAFENLLPQLSAKGCSVIMTSLNTTIPEGIDEVAVLDNGRLIRQVKRSEFNVADSRDDQHFQLDYGKLNNLFSPISKHIFNNLIQLKKVNIKYGDVVVFEDSDWQVKPGEKWAIVGANGAGKSTLLSLVNADHPQAYANDIILFDRRRGTGESIWDIKKNTGFVSAELFQYFPTEQNCMQVIESGYYDTIGLFRMSQPEKAGKCIEWMKLFNILEYARKLFNQAPTAVQRLVLLIRALVKNPALLILDEPTQGLNDYEQQRFKTIISGICGNPNLTMLYVTHQYHELPDCIDTVLKLSRGSAAKKVSRIELLNE